MTSADCPQLCCSLVIIGVHLQTEYKALQCIMLHVSGMITSQKECTFDEALYRAFSTRIIWLFKGSIAEPR